MTNHSEEYMTGFLTAVSFYWGSSGLADTLDVASIIYNNSLHLEKLPDVASFHTVMLTEARDCLLSDVGPFRAVTESYFHPSWLELQTEQTA